MRRLSDPVSGPTDWVLYHSWSPVRCFRRAACRKATGILRRDQEPAALRHAARQSRTFGPHRAGELRDIEHQSGDGGRFVDRTLEAEWNSLSPKRDGTAGAIDSQCVDRFTRCLIAPHVRDEWNASEEMRPRDDWLQAVIFAGTDLTPAEVVATAAGVAESFEIRFFKEQRQVSRGGGFPFIAAQHPRTTVSKREVPRSSLGQTRGGDVGRQLTFGWPDGCLQTSQRSILPELAGGRLIYRGRIFGCGHRSGGNRFDRRWFVGMSQRACQQGHRHRQQTHRVTDSPVSDFS